jgi:hypothetical protein
MLSLAERQRAIVGALVAGDVGALGTRDLGVVQGKPSVRRLADGIRRGRMDRVRAALPRTVEIIWMEFGVLLDDYARASVRRAVPAEEELEDFVDFMDVKKSSLMHAPPYLIDLARLELAIHRAGRPVEQWLKADISEDPDLRRIARISPSVWRGNYDLRPLFDRESAGDEVSPGESACLVWRAEEDGRLRVASVDPALAAAVEDLARQIQVADDSAVSAARALREIGVLGDAA